MGSDPHLYLHHSQGIPLDIVGLPALSPGTPQLLGPATQGVTISGKFLHKPITDDKALTVANIRMATQQISLKIEAQVLCRSTQDGAHTFEAHFLALSSNVVIRR